MITEFSVAPSIPYAKEAEEAVLGSILIDSGILPETRGIITEDEDFYIIRHKWIWQAICRLEDKRNPIDNLTVAEELDRFEQLKEVGGAAYLTYLVNQVPTTANAISYAQIVHSHRVRRRLLQSANTIAQLACNESKELEGVVSESLESVQFAANGLVGGNIQHSTSLASEFYDDIESNSKRKDLPGIPTGLLDLDVLLGGGLQNSDFLIVAGFPGMGKSGFLETVILNTSKTYWTGLFSLEMSNKQQIQRLASQMTGIDSQRIRNGRLRDNEWPLVTQATEKLGAMKIWMDETSYLSFPFLRAKCVQMKSRGMLDLIVLDYAGLMEALGNSTYERACYLSRNLKLLARELHIPLLAAHQLNRKAVDRSKPSMHDLRDSGSWEQDADVVMLIYDSENVAMEPGLAPRILDVNKQRNGPVGIVNLAMRNSTTRFENLTRVQL